MKLVTRNLSAVITSFTFLLVCMLSFAQGENLVPNPSFEEIEKKPKKLGSIANATGWIAPTGARSDIFLAGKSPDIDVPLNIYGKEDAKEGGNYAGIMAFSYGNKLPRTYVSGKLVSPLKKGMKYCVKMNISLAEASKYACNNMGIKLSKKQPGTDSKVSIIDQPSIVHFNNDLKIISARYNWTEICGEFEAEGGEKYITIGNFSSDEETKNERVKKDADIKVAQIVGAYYYIDDISVFLIDEEKGEKCDCAADDGGANYSKMIYHKVVNYTDDMTPTQKIEAHQTCFAFGKDDLSAEGVSTLDFIAETLTANPEFKLQITGHNNAQEDEVGTENDYYADMDSKRVASVVTYLKSKGIDEGRLIPATKGADVPNQDLSEEDDEELKEAKNRRVEFKVRM